MEGYFRNRHEKIKIGSVPLGQIASHTTGLSLRQNYISRNNNITFLKKKKKIIT